MNVSNLELYVLKYRLFWVDYEYDFLNNVY